MEKEKSIEELFDAIDAQPTTESDELVKALNDSVSKQQN
jgi:hypothetical protein